MPDYDLQSFLKKRFIVVERIKAACDLVKRVEDRQGNVSPTCIVALRTAVYLFARCISDLKTLFKELADIIHINKPMSNLSWRGYWTALHRVLSRTVLFQEDAQRLLRSHS